VRLLGALGPTPGLVVLVAGLICCAEPTRVRIAEAGGLTDVTLPSLLDLDTVSGEVGEILSDARIRFDRVDEVRDRGQNRELLVSHAKPVRAQYLVDSDRVAVPTDFDTLVMFSIYAHLERAALAFDALGVVVASTPVPVYYAPVMEGGTLPSTDAAAYYTGVDFFVVESAGDLPGLPLGANAGVVAHEYSHRVWYYELWRASLLEHLTAILDDEAQTASYNLLRAADEGVADYFGAVISDDASYIAQSFDQVDERRLDVTREVASAWVDGREPVRAGRYDPYPLGSVLASTLWRMRAHSDELDATIIATLRALFPSFPLDYQFGDFEIELLRQLDANARIDACDLFEDSYSVVWDRFTSVCP
jgi:hypothetical protein